MKRFTAALSNLTRPCTQLSICIHTHSHIHTHTHTHIQRHRQTVSQITIVVRDEKSQLCLWESVAAQSRASRICFLPTNTTQHHHRQLYVIVKLYYTIDTIPCNRQCANYTKHHSLITSHHLVLSSTNWFNPFHTCQHLENRTRYSAATKTLLESRLHGVSSPQPTRSQYLYLSRLHRLVYILTLKCLERNHTILQLVAHVSRQCQ